MFTFLVDIIIDEFGNSKDIDLILMSLAQKSDNYSKINYLTSKTFYSFAGSKLFRDAIYAGIRFIFQADHKYYKKHGIYDFPKKSFVSRLLKQLFKLKSFRKALNKNQRMLKEMIKPHQNIIKKY